MVLHWSSSAPPEGHGTVSGTLLAVNTLEGQLLVSSGVETSDAAKQPRMYRKGPKTKCPMLAVLRLRSSVLNTTLLTDLSRMGTTDLS